MQQCMELTNTNRSRAYPINIKRRFVSYLVFRESKLLISLQVGERSVHDFQHLAMLKPELCIW